MIQGSRQRKFPRFAAVLLTFSLVGGAFPNLAQAVLVSGKEVDLLPPSRQRASYLPHGSIQLHETPTGYRVRVEARSLFQSVSVGPVKLQFFSEPKCSGRFFAQAGKPVGPESRPLMVDQATNVIDQVTMEAPGLKAEARSVLLTGIVMGKKRGELTARRAVLCGVIPSKSAPMKVKSLRESTLGKSSVKGAKGRQKLKPVSARGGVRKKARGPSSDEVETFLDQTEAGGREPQSVESAVEDTAESALEITLQPASGLAAEASADASVDAEADTEEDVIGDLTPTEEERLPASLQELTRPSRSGGMQDWLD